MSIDLEPTLEQQLMRRRLHALRRRQLRLHARARQFDRDRLELFNEARSLDPPMSWQQIADVMGVTMASIANLVKRHNGTQTRKKPS